MSRNTRLILKIGGIIIFLALVIALIFRYTTKAHSPEDTVVYTKEDLEIEVFYNRPYKRDRDIFGKLVPYNEVWRTGANEATTFETNKDLQVDGSLLKAGKYTLWTIPMENSWKIMFNSKMYPWGINMDKQAYRDPRFDELVLERPVQQTGMVYEQFTIAFEASGEFIFMSLAWDDTLINIPIKEKEAPTGTSLD
ncbi:DUF2911 domain-containing protein [Christiangramia sabulilitoris]|uniref:DUF2911 domain-containing protein n=1 Tax=Christiangramia sabulilitoris TaxID=2583991 RepID=A0A550HYZ5_9FLAO|nr:DUF2911 domain-containing protein [Christiangramia sabulilitoris]TRO63953.1 DUF2911 domain-containing protein [Christiangramia sabulilitoris]